MSCIPYQEASLPCHDRTTGPCRCSWCRQQVRSESQPRSRHRTYRGTFLPAPTPLQSKCAKFMLSFDVVLLTDGFWRSCPRQLLYFLPQFVLQRPFSPIVLLHNASRNVSVYSTVDSFITHWRHHVTQLTITQMRHLHVCIAQLAVFHFVPKFVCKCVACSMKLRRWIFLGDFQPTTNFISSSTLYFTSSADMCMQCHNKHS